MPTGHYRPASHSRRTGGPGNNPRENTPNKGNRATNPCRLRTDYTPYGKKRIPTGTIHPRGTGTRKRTKIIETTIQVIQHPFIKHIKKQQKTIMLRTGIRVSGL